MNSAEYLNQLSTSDAEAKLAHCCASARWVDLMMSARPYADDAALEMAAQRANDSLSREDWLQAFSGHPRIGDINSLRAKFASTKAWASAEQSGVQAANEETLQELAACNDLYFDRFGYIFIVCATGKSADEMLTILKSRLANSPEDELPIAAAEQQKITWIRLQKIAS